MISNNKFSADDALDQHGYSIDILKSEVIFQYILNLSEMLPDTHPNVFLENNEEFYRLWSEDCTELFTVFSAFIDAIILY